MKEYGQLEYIQEYIVTHEMNCEPSLFISLTVFSYIYVRYYRLEDLADFQNYINTYISFQKILFLLSAMGPQKRKAIPGLKLFDIERLDESLDILRIKQGKTDPRLSLPRAQNEVKWLIYCTETATTSEDRLLFGSRFKTPINEETESTLSCSACLRMHQANI